MFRRGLPFKLAFQILLASGASPLLSESPIIDNRTTVYSQGDAHSSTDEATAQAFTTGNGEAVLSAVEVVLELRSDSTIAVKLWSGSENSPATVVEDLGQQSATGSGSSTLRFVSSSRPILAPSTRYWISVANVSGDFDWTLTADATNPAGPGSFVNLTRGSSNGGTTWPDPGASGDFRRMAVFSVDLGALDTNFNPPAGLSNSVYTLLQQANGRVLAGGSFLDVGGSATRDYIFRLNADGSLDETFNPPTEIRGDILSLVQQTDGRVLAGGGFLFIGTNGSRDRLIRLNADGGLDTNFNPPGGLNNGVNSITPLPDGRILVGGAFTNVAGDDIRDYLIRLNSDGSLDESFDTETVLNDWVRTVVTGTDGKILVGGRFSDAGGDIYRDRLVRLNLDGSLDTSFNPPASLNNDVITLAMQSDGRILVGGTFTDVGGETDRDRLIRLNTDGSLDTTFIPFSNLNSSIYSLIPLSDGRVLVGGSFVNANGEAIRDRIICINADGSLDESFNPPSNLNNTVWAVVPQSDGQLLVGGLFTDVGGEVDRDRLIRLDYERGTSKLSVPDLTQVRWLRGGASPEAYRVEFEVSTDGGISFSFLGEGKRINGGWDLHGLRLPATATIRARAHVPSGISNGSVAHYEESLSINMTGTPSIRLKGKSRLTTTRSSITLRGTANDPDNDLLSVRYRSGKRTRLAKGTSAWSAKVSLNPGLNRILVQAYDSRGVVSRPVTVIIRRG